MAHASLPGWAGHQDAPASVVPVSSSTKKHAMSASTARLFRVSLLPVSLLRHAHDLMLTLLTLLTLWHNPTGARSGETFGGCGTY